MTMVGIPNMRPLEIMSLAMSVRAALVTLPEWTELRRKLREQTDVPIQALLTNKFWDEHWRSDSFAYNLSLISKGSCTRKALRIPLTIAWNTAAR